jgi:hypothetical protein
MSTVSATTKKNFTQLREIISFNSSPHHPLTEQFDVIGYDEDILCNSSCVCGQKHIRFLHTIKNIHTGEQFHPIGSSCVKQFHNAKMNRDAKELKKTFVSTQQQKEQAEKMASMKHPCSVPFCTGRTDNDTDRYCEDCEKDCKRSAKYFVGFGKYKTFTVQWLVDNQMGYVNWFEKQQKPMFHTEQSDKYHKNNKYKRAVLVNALAQNSDT